MNKTVANNACAVDYVDPPELIGLVGHLRHHPQDDAARHILADLLDELGPGPVRVGKLPPWLRLCWLRSRTRAATHPATATAQVVREMSTFGPADWGHWGTATVAGLSCLVAEDYRPTYQPCMVLVALASQLPCCARAYSRRGAWFPGTVRGILFPPLVMPPPKKRRRADWAARAMADEDG
jgi:hypothetical protein